MIVVRIKTKENFLTYGAKVFSFCHVSTLHVFQNIAFAARVVALTTQPFASTKWANLGFNFRICTGKIIETMTPYNFFHFIFYSYFCGLDTDDCCKNSDQR